MIGTLSIARSTKCCTPLLRFFAWRKPTTAATNTSNSNQPELCTNFEMSITSRVIAGRDEAHEQVVEVQRMLRERVGERRAALDVALDCEDQLLHRGVLVAGADDVERLHERNARGHHRRELAREDRDVAGRDAALLPKQHALLADARRRDALAAELRSDGTLVRGDDLSLDPLAGPIHALPGEWDLADCCRLSHE